MIPCWATNKLFFPSLCWSGGSTLHLIASVTLPTLWPSSLSLFSDTRTNSRRRPILCLRKIETPWTLYSPWHPCSSRNVGAMVHHFVSTDLMLQNTSCSLATLQGSGITGGCLPTAASRVGTKMSIWDVCFSQTKLLDH